MEDRETYDALALVHDEIKNAAAKIEAEQAQTTKTNSWANWYVYFATRFNMIKANLRLAAQEKQISWQDQKLYDSRLEN